MQGTATAVAIDNRPPGEQAGRLAGTGRLAVAACLLLLGWAFGLAFAHIPNADTPRSVWLGNLAAPWVVLPFAAGWIIRRWPGALAGAAVCAASIYGFYGHDFDPQFTWSIGHLEYLAQWMLIAVPVGLAYGFVGAAWGKSRSLFAAVLIALPFVIEPFWQTAKAGYVPRPYAIWIVELVVGLLVFALLRHRREAGK